MPWHAGLPDRKVANQAGITNITVMRDHYFDRRTVSTAAADVL